MKDYLIFRSFIQVGTKVALKANGNSKTGIVVCKDCIGSFCVLISNFIGIGCKEKGFPWKITWEEFENGMVSNNVNCKDIIVI